MHGMWNPQQHYYYSGPSILRSLITTHSARKSCLKFNVVLKGWDVYIENIKVVLLLAVLQCNQWSGLIPVILRNWNIKQILVILRLNFLL